MKKRVRVPFPPAANSSTVVKPKKILKANNTVTDSNGSASRQDRTRAHMELLAERKATKKKEISIIQELSAHKHPFSIKLCSEFDSLMPSSLPAEIICMSKSDGKILFTVDLKSSSGYGLCTWSFSLGGRVGDDMSPVGLRCTNQISHYQVDDMGFISATFWKALTIRSGNGIEHSGKAQEHSEKTGPLSHPSLDPLPTLLDILRGVIDMLRGPFHAMNHPCHEDMSQDSVPDLDGYSTAEHQARWDIAEKEATQKVKLKLGYIAHSLFPALFSAGVGSKKVCGAGDTMTTGVIGKRGNDSKPVNESSSSTVHDSTWPDLSWLAPSFLLLMDAMRTLADPRSTTEQLDSAEQEVSHLVVENSPGIFSFDLFSSSFCDTLIEELDNYEASGYPQKRPNTMNNYGLIVNEMGLQSLMDSLLQLVEPLAQRVFAAEPVAYGLDHHHSFIVQYKSDHLLGDRGLDMHHDASEVTLNVCLGRDGFQGGDLLFCGLADSAQHRKYQYSLKHIKGRAVMHLGRHRHGAEDISPAVTHGSDAATSGVSVDSHDTTEQKSDAISGHKDHSERLNLIMWMRSSVFRSAAAYGHISPDGFPRTKEDGEPDVCCLSRFNDSDYDQYISGRGNGD